MKRVFLVIGVFMVVFTLAMTQAFSQQKGMQYGQSTQIGQSDLPGAGQISRASELLDKKVRNQQGQDLGQVEDLVFSSDGKISYIIISQGGVMGIGDKLTPIPFKNAQLNAQQDAVILSNIDKQTLQNAPTIGQNDWQKLQDPGFETEVFSYYGQQSGGQPSGQGMMPQGMGPGGSGSRQQSDQMMRQMPGPGMMQQQGSGQSGR